MDGRVCTAIHDLLIDRIKNSDVQIDAIVGLDARGFLFGFAISAHLGIPFVPIRKKGKLPGKCRSFEYTLEYGTGTLEMQVNHLFNYFIFLLLEQRFSNNPIFQENAIRPGQNVAIVDDLLATGGTLNAAYQLITASGANVQEIVVIMELKSLRGREKIPTKNIHTLIEYDL